LLFGYFLTLLLGSFALKFVYCAHIFDDTAYLVVKHNDHKYGKEQTQENGKTSDDPCSSFNKHPAVVAHAVITF